MRLFNDIRRPLARLTFLAFIVMPYQAFAGEEPWSLSPSESIMIVHPAPGIDYLTDLHQHSASLYDTAPGLRWYSAQNAQGQITAQGFLFDPVPAPIISRTDSLAPIFRVNPAVNSSAPR